MTRFLFCYSATVKSIKEGSYNVHIPIQELFVDVITPPVHTGPEVITSWSIFDVRDDGQNPQSLFHEKPHYKV